MPIASSRPGSAGSCAARIGGASVAAALASITAIARAGCLNASTRRIARATANSPLTGSPPRDIRSVGTSKKPRARTFVAETTRVRSVMPWSYHAEVSSS